MSDPKVSEGMLNLVTDFGADCINYGCNQLRPMVGYPTIENVEHKSKELALLSAIAALEARAETAEAERDKWKEAALAIREGALYARGFMLTKRVEVAFEALGPAWYEALAVKGEE